jgi:ABC-type dipeptide/oligopeptide/nickel transport system ATPase component
VGIVDAARILKTYPHQISGGMAQRVAIALALAGRPRLLVADEPTTALDVTVQAEILSLLRSLVKDTGMSVVMVTHDLGVVADLCDQVAVMYAGEVVENGRTDSILDNPRHPYTLALLAADPHANHAADMPERLATINGPGSAAQGLAQHLPLRRPLPVRRLRLPGARPAASLRCRRRRGALRQGGRTGRRRPGLGGHRRTQPPHSEPVRNQDC